MNIDKRQLEKLTTSLAIILLTTMVLVLTLAAANSIFRWDLFPPEIEKAGGVFVVSSLSIIFASVIINIMINIGRIADKLDDK